MKCKHCKKDIIDGAIKCPECQSDLRNWFVRHKIITGILILFVLGSVLSATDDSNSTTKTVVTESGEEVEVPKEYQSIISLKTSSTKNSDSFKLTGGKQKLVYSVNKKQFSSCSIYLLTEGTDLQTDGGLPVVMMAEESGETILRKSSGNYYISVSSINSTCNVELFEYR